MNKINYFIEQNNVDTMSFDWGKLTITCSPEVNGSKQFSAGVVTMQPKKGHDRHNHPGAEEIIFVISGNGEQMIEDEKGKPIIKSVTPGSTIYIPADRYHSTLNKGDTEMKVFVVYSPPGSELTFKKFPDFKLIKAIQN